MKTPQEWLDQEQWHEIGDNDVLELIAKVQADARRQGVIDAEETAESLNLNNDAA